MPFIHPYGKAALGREHNCYHTDSRAIETELIY